MTDEVGNLVLEQLRLVRTSMQRMELDRGDIKLRVSSLEQNMGQVVTALGAVNGRLDRLEERVARIERRLDLVDA